MAMSNCPECGCRISERATVCPYCGFSSNDGAIIPIVSLTPTSHAPRAIVPEASIFGDIGNLVPESISNTLVAFFENADNMQRYAPAVFDVIDKAVSETGPHYLAEFSKKARELMDKGEVVFSVDSKTKELLPQVRDIHNGQIVEKARIKIENMPSELASSLATLQTQVMVAQIMDEIKAVAASVENLRLEAQADRFAKAESAWLQLQQAAHIRDSRLRELKMISLAEKACDVRCMLEGNFKANLSFANDKKGAHSVRGQAADTAMVDLSIISLMARTEYAAYTLLGEDAAASESLHQFKTFIEANRLDDRDTLLRINSRSAQNRAAVVDGFSSIAYNIVHLQLSDGDTPPSHELPE